MIKYGYSYGKYAEGYFKTLITTASFFGRNKEAAQIFKETNENSKLQNVIIVIIIFIRFSHGKAFIQQESANYSPIIWRIYFQAT